jgi:hypothetical protein
MIIIISETTKNPKVSLMKLHWTPLTPHKRDTVWATVPKIVVPEAIFSSDFAIKTGQPVKVVSMLCYAIL